MSMKECVQVVTIFLFIEEERNVSDVVLSGCCR